MAGSGAIRAGRAFVELFADDSKLNRGLQAAGKKLKDWGAGIAALGAKAFAGGSAIVAGALGTAKAFADMGSEINDLAARTGIGTDELQALSFAAAQTGGSVEELEVGLRKMQKTIGDAAAGEKAAQEELAKLGMTAQQLQQLAPDQQMEAFAQAISRIEDPASRTAAAMDVFGKSGTKLLPMLSAIDELTARAKSRGLIMSKEDVEAADALGDAFDEAQLAIKLTVAQVGAALAPLLRETLDLVVPIAKGISGWVRNNQDLIRTVFKVAAGVAAGGAALVALGGVIAGVGVAIAHWKLVLLGAAAAWFSTTEAGQRAVGIFGGIWEQIKGDAMGAWGGIVAAVKAGDLELAGQIALQGLKVAWVTAWTFLRSSWLDFKGFFIETFQSAVFLIANMINDVVAEARKAIARVVGLGARLGAALGPTGAALAAAGRAVGTEGDATADQEAIRAQLGADQGREKADRKREADKAVGALRAEMDAERAKLKALVDQANNKRAEAVVKIGQAWDERMAAKDVPKAMKGEAQGTFNAAAIRALGGSTVQQRQLDELQRIRELIAQGAQIGEAFAQFE